MSWIKSTFLPVYFSLMLGTALSGQDPAFIKYDTKDGLPSSEVYDLEIDNFGRIWFTTDRGVCTYDGYDFSVYTNRDGLTNNTNFDIFQDSKGRLWFPALDGTLSVYENDTFGIFGNRAMYDSISHGTWIESQVESYSNKLYFSWFRRPEYFHEIDFESSTLISRSLDDLAREYGKISNGSFHIIPIGTKGILVHPEAIRGEEVHRYKNGWLFFLESELSYWNEDGSIVQKVDLGTGIERIYIDDLEQIWVSSRGGLYLFSNSNLYDKPQVFFKNDEVTSIIKDREGCYWLATLEGGLKYVPNFKLQTIKFNESQISTERTLVGASLDQHILFGTTQESIISIDRQFNLDRLHTRRREGTHISTAGREDNVLWFSRQLRVEEKGSSLSVSHQVLNNKSHAYKLIKPLSNGDKIISGYRFKCIIPADKNVCDYILPLDTEINSVVERNDGVIYIGSMGGLYSIRIDDYYNLIDESEGNPLLKARISDLQLSSQGHLWVATNGEGLIFKSADSIVHICEEQGLLSNLINAILPVGDSLLWVAGNKGLNLVSYKIEDNTLRIFDIKSYTTSDGLLSNYVSDVDFWNGHIWLSNDYGITYFKPEYLQDEYPPVTIVLDQFDVNGEKITAKKILKYAQNDIHFSFTGYSYSKPERLPFYKYRLTRNEETYSEVTTNDRNAQFIDLPYGQYQFQVAARNKNDQWSSDPIIHDFEIERHFTQSWWFRFLAFFGLIGLGLLIGFARYHAFKTKELHKRKLQKTQLQLKAAELDTLRNQVNPHFIFNSLNSIQRFIFNNDINQSNKYLSKFSRLIRSSLELSRLQFITLKQEIEFIENYLEMEMMRFPDKFTFEINIQEEIQPNQCYVPSLLFQPVLENSIKHGFRDIKHKGHIQIDIRTNKDADVLDVIIEDNGTGQIGTTHRPNHQSLGLKIIRERMDLLYEEREGATFRHRTLLPLIHQKTGYKAHFSIPLRMTNETTFSNN
jgi:ligand-binding sensor domain-containing protein